MEQAQTKFDIIGAGDHRRVVEINSNILPGFLEAIG
jgi:hypothetical protein